jgi:hypothetical protein
MIAVPQSSVPHLGTAFFCRIGFGSKLLRIRCLRNREPSYRFGRAPFLRAHETVLAEMACWYLDDISKGTHRFDCSGQKFVDTHGP